MRALATLRLLFPVVAALVAGASLARAESMDELYAKARLEQTLALYGAGPTGSHDRWIRDFEQRFPGVAVTLTGGLSNGLNRRIEQQLAAKRMETDLAIFQTIQDFGRWKKAGALLLFKPEGFEAIDPAYKDEDGAFTAVSVNTVVYAYNSARVPAAEVPRSALDFLKPQFAGALITTDPTQDDAGLSAFNVIVQKYGWDYMDRYMAQKPVFVTSGHAAVSNAIAAGEKLATFDSTSTTPRLKAQGKPIEPVFSQADPTPVFLVGAAIFKDAPHPNAAKLYLTWYLAKEQQSRTGTFSPRADVPPPAGFAPLASYNIERGYRALVSDEARLTALRKRFAGYIGSR
ncbi:MAG TPA: extracellular solute-binding protein [Xanthobacteraceae bacterium]|jgi:ABC-type Fe3+ transport system substrate-binding protein